VVTLCFSHQNGAKYLSLQQDFLTKWAQNHIQGLVIAPCYKDKLQDKFLVKKVNNQEVEGSILCIH